MKLTIWLMYFVICCYSIVDYFSTKALIDSGAEEVNPLLMWLVNLNGDWLNILYFKICTLIFTGILLYRYLHLKGVENEN